MCGILYMHDFNGNPVNNNILQQFDKQRSRGTEGFGVYDGQHDHLVKEAKENKILDWLCKPQNHSNILLFHHRWPTSTINVKQAAHPFTTGDYFGDSEYILIHNGVITNDDDLFVKHQAVGIQYKSLLPDLTFNDSEALLWDIALTLEGKQKAVTAYGRVAFIALKLTAGKLDKLYFGRNVSPLNLLRTKGGIMLSSEGEGEAIDPDTLYTWNYALKRLTTRDLKLPQWRPYVAGEYSSTWTPRGNACGYGEDQWNNAYHSYSDDEWDRWGKKAVDKRLVEDKWTALRASAAKALLQANPQAYVDEQAEYADAGYTYLHDKEEVDDKVFAYLLSCAGSFEQAYWSVEQDYDSALEEAEATYDYYDASLLEAVMDAIMKDPEYINENSVSSMWRALCQPAV